jgi:hypothetical protein
MKMLLKMLVSVLFISFLCGCEESAQEQQARAMKEDLKANKKIYKYEKKALKREYKLEKLKAKIETYKALDKIVQDTNEIKTINTSVTHQTVEKK